MSQTAEEFYAQRDERTNRITQSDAYQKVAIRLSIDPLWAKTFAGQVAFITAANILARWCRRVQLEAPDVALAPHLGYDHKRLLSRVLAEMEGADPYGCFEVSTKGDPCTYHLHLGPGGPPQADWHVMGTDWQALVTQTPIPEQQGDPLNPIGSMGAACLGVATAFMKALGQTPGWAEPTRVDFFGFSAGKQPMPFPQHLNLGRTWMVGAGAVGGCILYFLKMLPATGTLFTIDHDLAKVLNLNRSMLLSKADVGKYKVAAAESYFRNHPLQVQGIPAKYQEFLEEQGSLNADLVIPVANEFGVRRDLASGYPPLMIYGSTGADWSAHLGRHIPFREDCLACRFPVGSIAAPMACGSGPLQPQTSGQPDAALPFLSPLAALLAIAEIAKLQLPGYPFHGNRLALDLGGALHPLFPAQTEARSSCAACAEKSKKIFSALRGKTQWAGLSRTG